MFSLVQKRKWYFILSALIIIPGLLLMGYNIATLGAPFRLSIDFVGGSLYEVQFTQDGVNEDMIRTAMSSVSDSNMIIQRLGAVEERTWSIRAEFQAQASGREAVLTALRTLAPINDDSIRTDNVSPTIGSEVTLAAFLAVLASTFVVTGFIVFAFRQVPNRAVYGICAILAMFHDVLVISSLVALGGLVFGWEVDALFLTAILMTVAFSVQDTIVMYDRIRENLPRYLGEPYETIVNRSVLETLHRSLATQLNAFFVITAILLFGGASIKQFVAMLFIGLLTGTYSSIFTAVPLLVAWQKGEIPFVTQKNKRKNEELSGAEA
jgi:preprotein translocase SecF subunit